MIIMIQLILFIISIVGGTLTGNVVLKYYIEKQTKLVGEVTDEATFGFLTSLMDTVADEEAISLIEEVIMQIKTSSEKDWSEIVTETQKRIGSITGRLRRVVNFASVLEKSNREIKGLRTLSTITRITSGIIILITLVDAVFYAEVIIMKSKYYIPFLYITIQLTIASSCVIVAEVLNLYLKQREMKKWLKVNRVGGKVEGKLAGGDVHREEDDREDMAN